MSAGMQLPLIVTYASQGIFLDVEGDGDEVEIGFMGESAPARVRDMLQKDKTLIMNGCEREWIAPVFRDEIIKGRLLDQ